MTQSTQVMTDFVFGGIESDETHLLESERTFARGLRHHCQIDPLDPQPGQSVTITAFVGPDVLVDHVTAYVTTDGSDPQGQRGMATNAIAIELIANDVRWESLLWAYSQRWTGVIPAQPTGTYVRYRIEGWCSYDSSVSVWSSEPNLDRSAERPTLYGYTVDTYTTPRWAKEAIIYQVFVDRFAKEVGPGGQGDRETRITDHGSRITNHQSPLYLSADELNDFWGGTLRGVIDHLDYIADLGVNTLWLTPFFLTTSYHGYDTTDYYKVDPRFGSNVDACELIAEAHKRGLRVVIDFVANHTSTEFAPFAQAQHNPKSPFRRWFSFGPAYKQGYRAFFDVASMPQLDLDDPDARQFMIDAAVHWLTEYGADGLRLDYAAGPSHDFWAAFRLACRQAKPDCWLFGEVTRAGDLLRSYTGKLDGCLDFAFCRSVRQLINSLHSSPTTSANETPNSQFAIHNSQLALFAAELTRSRAFFGNDFTLPAFIDNHDMNRFLFVVGDDQAKLKLAAGLLFAFGEAPILYYGTEVGLSQPRAKSPWREEARHPMWWGDQQDAKLVAWFKEWIGFRRNHRALIDGELRTKVLECTTGVWVVERTTINDTSHDQVLIIVNLGMNPHAFHLSDGEWHTSAGAVCSGIITTQPRSLQLLAKRV